MNEEFERAAESQGAEDNNKIAEVQSAGLESNQKLTEYEAGEPTCIQQHPISISLTPTSPCYVPHRPNKQRSRELYQFTSVCGETVVFNGSFELFF
jgi:hypothetical protein